MKEKNVNRISGYLKVTNTEVLTVNWRYKSAICRRKIFVKCLDTNDMSNLKVKLMKK